MDKSNDQFPILKPETNEILLSRCRFVEVKQRHTIMTINIKGKIKIDTDSQTIYYHI